MIYSYFITLKYFFLASFFYLFRFKKNQKLFLSGTVLLTKKSQRLKDNSTPDSLIAARLWKRVVFSVWKNSTSKVIFNFSHGNSSAIFDGKQQNYNLRINHVKQNSGDISVIFIARENLLFAENYFFKLFIISCVSFVSIFISLLSLIYRKHRNNLALIISELVECSNLLYVLKKNKIQKLHFYCPYENDANVCAYILMKEKIFVNKIPSPGPLSGHNGILLADSVSATSKYHLDEILHFQNSIIINEINKWTPEFSNDYTNKYAVSTTPPPLTIGYYSSASWLRTMQKNFGALVPGSMEEDELLYALKEYIEVKKNSALVIFPHPKEKSDDVFSKTVLHYESILKKTNYRIADSALRSSECFEQVDVGTGVYSTVLFERLFSGFKTLFFPYAVKDFPVAHSTLNNICVFEKNSLFEKLDEALELSKEIFFEKNGIKEYFFFGVKQN